MNDDLRLSVRNVFVDLLAQGSGFHVAIRFQYVHRPVTIRRKDIKQTE